MKDPWNPINDELRDWAFDAEALQPTQDFDLAVSHLYFSEIIIELASDDRCPKQKFFLACSYLIVGDAVRTDYHTERKKDVIAFLENAKSNGHKYLLNLVERSTKLMNTPSLFDYDQWCDGGLAYAEIKS